MVNKAVVGKLLFGGGLSELVGVYGGGRCGAAIVSKSQSCYCD